MVGSLINKQGRQVSLYRTFTKNSDLSSTQYLPATQFKIGINGDDPLTSNTAIDNPIPISDGTSIDGGDNNFTGSSGGDNSTDNTTTYKEGAGLSDATSQNLIANNTNVLKIWTLTLTTYPNSAQYTGMWFYILDATALAKFKSSGTCLEIKLGSDSSNYYSITYEVSNLSTGWTWLDFGTLSDLTETGTVSGNIDTFIIEITTNNATDTFSTGDVIYDLLRQWQDSDLVKDFTTGYPTLNFSTLEATTRCYLTTLELNGFLFDSLGTYNEDTSPLLTSEDNYSDESKSSTDEFAFVIVDRYE